MNTKQRNEETAWKSRNLTRNIIILSSEKERYIAPKEPQVLESIARFRDGNSVLCSIGVPTLTLDAKITGIQFQGQDLFFEQNENQACVQLTREYKNEPAYMLTMTTED